jgi:2-methylcitrate dehydratase PrpD
MDPPLADGATRRLARWAAEQRVEAIPPTVIAAACTLALDTFGCAWAAADAEGIAALRAHAAEEESRGQATVWVHGERATASRAALINGTMAAALDFDPLHDRATVHADIVTLPAALAVAERVGATGRDVVAAQIVGDELLCRLGLALVDHPGWFYTSVLGAFGAAAAAGRLLGLDAARMTHAFGIALSRAAGTQQSLVERRLTKRLQSAFAAEAGVEAALLAARGLTGPAEALEGRAGFEALYSRLDMDVLFAGLGREFEMARLTLKKYPSCFCNHVAIEATLALRARGLTAEAVDEIEVVLSPFMERLVGAPFDPGASPQVAAQFSVQYSIACALVRGRLGVAEISDAAVCSPTLLALARRVRMRTDPAHTARFAPIEVTARTRDGRVLAARGEVLPGTPDHPLSAAEIEAKFRANVAEGPRALGARAADALMGRLRDLDSIGPIARLFDPLPD